MHPNLDAWICEDSILFTHDEPASFAAAIDKILSAPGMSDLDILGFGEHLHSGETILQLRNQLFQHLVLTHGYTAIAVESSFPRGLLVDEYIAGRGPAAGYDDIREAGFGQGFGRLEANRDLVEWMRRHNTAHPEKQIHFHGFDIPAATTPGITSPHAVLLFVVDYLQSIDPALGERYRQKIIPHLGEEAPWVNPAAYMDPTASIGLSSAANALRLATEDLIVELNIRRPDLCAASGRDRFEEALQHARVALAFLAFHATMATTFDGANPMAARMGKTLAIRDAIMADTLSYISATESRRHGKVLVFAHNSHLLLGRARLSLGADTITWWPAGALLKETIGSRYAVIGTALGESESNAISPPEPGTLENLFLTHLSSPAYGSTQGSLMISTENAPRNGFPIRNAGAKNRSYIPLAADSFSNFTYIAFIPSDTYARGGWPLPG